ncbi:MAG: Cyanophage [Verrucomicrobiota bacterium]|jgi:hypothetical protein
MSLLYAIQAQRRRMDADAVNYLAAVEAADGQTLEASVRKAYDDFFKGCKDDNIWDAIKASCILAGARTLAGALVPLKGAAPTNFNFVSGDYVRKTGLIGNGSTKYLSSNRANNADPQNNKHLSVWRTNLVQAQAALIGNFTSASGASWIFDGTATNGDTIRLNQSASVTGLQLQQTGLIAASRSDSSTISARVASGFNTYTAASVTPVSQTLDVFRGVNFYANARLTFYSIGEAIDLAKLETRVSNLMTDLNTAIA